jgi:hypothetical protein
MSKISQSLVSSANDLQSSTDKLQKYLDDRKGSLGKFNSDVLGDAKNFASDIYTENTMSDYGDLINQYKNNIDPRNKPPKTYDPNFDGNTDNVPVVMYNDSIFTQLDTADIWKSYFKYKTLTPVFASKAPIFPMVFRVVLPATASNRTPADDLILFVNPYNWSRTVSKAQQNIWTRNGIKTERWGDDLEQINASGKIGGFYTAETGLTRFERWQTASYLNFLNLLQIYKNNGCLFGTTYNEDVVPSSRNRILDVGYIIITYADDIFIGNFESFDISENADNPFSLEYNFVFNCSAVVSSFDLNPVSSSSHREVESTDATSDYLSGERVTALEAAMKAAGEPVKSDTNSIFTSPNKTISESPKDTLFPSLVSGLGKKDSTKPFIYKAGGANNSRGDIKVDFRDATESSEFYAGLPSQENLILNYILDFVEKQKNRSNG